MQKQILSPLLDGHYTLKGMQATRAKLPESMGGKEVDFRTLTLKQAKELYDAGCTYLVPVATKPDRATKEKPGFKEES
jgi:hypothetical protein